MQSERGQAMIEYLLVAAAIIAALVLVVPSLGTAVKTVLTNAIGRVTNQSQGTGSVSF